MAAGPIDKSNSTPAAHDRPTVATPSTTQQQRQRRQRRVPLTKPGPSPFSPFSQLPLYLPLGPMLAATSQGPPAGASQHAAQNSGTTPCSLTRESCQQGALPAAVLMRTGHQQEASSTAPLLQCAASPAALQRTVHQYDALASLALQSQAVCSSASPAHTSHQPEGACTALVRQPATLAQADHRHDALAVLQLAAQPRPVNSGAAAACASQPACQMLRPRQQLAMTRERLGCGGEPQSSPGLSSALEPRGKGCDEVDVYHVSLPWVPQDKQHLERCPVASLLSYVNAALCITSV